MRPAHVHFLVTAEGFRPLVTHVFTAGGPHLGSDAVFGVKESLVVELAEQPGGAWSRRAGPDRPVVPLHLRPRPRQRSRAMTPELETEVPVIGGGPAGAAAALFLATYGVEHLVITKYRWTANTPRAHHRPAHRRGATRDGR